MPPVVTGTIVALIGFNLAPAAWNNVKVAPVTAIVTLGSIILVSVFFRGILGRLAILLGVLVGYVVALVRGEVDFDAVRDGGLDRPARLRHAHVRRRACSACSCPWSFVLVAENVGHVKSVAAMTGNDLDAADRPRAASPTALATTLAGLGGGSGTTTYAENIGVMAATRVYSTAAYWVAAGQRDRPRPLAQVRRARSPRSRRACSAARRRCSTA